MKKTTIFLAGVATGAFAIWMLGLFSNGRYAMPSERMILDTRTGVVYLTGEELRLEAPSNAWPLLGE